MIEVKISKDGREYIDNGLRHSVRKCYKTRRSLIGRIKSWERRYGEKYRVSCSGILHEKKLVDWDKFGISYKQNKKRRYAVLSYKCTNCKKAEWAKRTRTKAQEKRLARKKRGSKKTKIHMKVAYAKKKGLLVEEPCLVCGSTNDLVAHHFSYERDYMLSVVWLCRSCHGKYHKQSSYNYTGRQLLPKGGIEKINAKIEELVERWIDQEFERSRKTREKRLEDKLNDE